MNAGVEERELKMMGEGAGEYIGTSGDGRKLDWHVDGACRWKIRRMFEHA